MSKDLEADMSGTSAVGRGHDNLLDDPLNGEWEDRGIRGLYGALPPNTDALDAPECGQARAFLPYMFSNEWRRVHLIRPGTRLSAGEHYVDLRELNRGVMVAGGDEVANSASLFVSRNDVDREIWNRLLGCEAQDTA